MKNHQTYPISIPTFSKSGICSLVVTSPISFSPTVSGIASVITYKSEEILLKKRSSNENVDQENQLISCFKIVEKEFHG